MEIQGWEASRYITFNYVAVDIDIEKLVYSSIPVVSNKQTDCLLFSTKILLKNTVEQTDFLQ